MKRQPAHLSLYRWRYTLGYSLLGAIFLISVTAASLYSPGGLTQAEVAAIGQTNALAQGDFAIQNLPFHLLQLASFSLFGVSMLTIKLPAIILSVVAAGAIFFLLRRWFKSNVAILSMLIMTATGQFIFLAQHATSQILYVTYSALILLFASLILQKAKGARIWKIGLAISVALSCFTPYFIYINVGLLIAALFHPHPRHHLLRRSQRLNWIIASATLFLFIAPIAYLCIQRPELFTELLGYERLQLDVLANIKILLQSYFWVAPIVTAGSHVAPIMDFSALALVLLGAMVMFQHRYTARTYVIVAWLLLTLPVLILRPHLTAIVLVPLFILLAIGVETLLSEWYRLFPKNPYARTAGLVLLIILIGAMVFSGIDRFTHAYRHLPEAAQRFSTDISLTRNYLRSEPGKAYLLVESTERPLYDALDRFNSFDITVSTEPPTDEVRTIVTHAAHQTAPTNDWELLRIITDDRAENANRLYLYKPN